MARVWIYDLNNTSKYKESVKRAKNARRQPPARWQVMYYDLNGDLKSEALATKTQADNRRTELEHTLLDGTYVDPAAARVAVAEIADKWIDARHDLRRSTWWKYRGLLDNHVLPRWGELPLNKVSKEDIEVWVATLLKSKDDGGSGLGPSQARHAYRVLAMGAGMVCTHAPAPKPRAWRDGPRPPRDRTRLPHLRTGRSAGCRLRTPGHQYHQPTAGAPINRALILLLAYTGIRWGEAAALRVGRLDLTNRRIRIASTFVEVNGVQHEGLPKTGKRRTVPIPEFLCPILEEMTASRDDHDLLFLTRRGQSLRANNWRTREFNPAVTAAGLTIPGLTPHKLRPTAASLAIAAGADVKVIQTMLGHTDEVPPRSWRHGL